MRGYAKPRIWTPPLRELTPETTLGFDVVQFARDVLDVELYPWQRWLLVHALEITGEFTGEWHFRYRTVIVLVARQNGKTTLGMVVALFFLYMLGVGLVLGTAQDLEQAEDTWAACVEMAQANDDLAAEIRHVWYTNGAKRLSLTEGRDYRVKASTRKAGRGKSADLVFLDELREHQTWDAYSALSKTGMAREDALLWCMSNAGDGASVVLRHLRLQAHAALGDPDGEVRRLGDRDREDVEGPPDESLGIFEWSAPPTADKWDAKAWCQANPSLGYCITERAVRAACATDPDEVFKTECLCQWVTSAIAPPFPRGAWEAGTDPDSEIAPDAPLWWGVDVSADRGHAAIAVCGQRTDGNWHGEVVAYQPGTNWVAGWFQDVAPNYREPMQVALQANGAPSSYLADVLNAIDGVEVTGCKGPAVAAWCGRLWDAVAVLDPVGGEDPDASRSDAIPIYHRPQPVLDIAANTAATRPMGDGAWAWNRNKSTEDVCALFAVTLAHGLATQVEAEPPKAAYEDHDLMFV